MKRGVTFVKRFILYFKKHHRWIIGLIIAILVIPLAGIFYQVLLRGYLEPETKQKYYLAQELRNTETNEKVICSESFLSDRTDARSCKKKDNERYSYDPCFLVKSKNYVDCPHDPEKNISEQFEIFIPDEGGGAGGGGPSWFDALEEKTWFLKLTSGHMCKANVETIIISSQFSHPFGVDYLCDNKDLKLILPINISKESWTIRCLDSRYNIIEFCKVDTAWF